MVGALGSLISEETEVKSKPMIEFGCMLISLRSSRT